MVAIFVLAAVEFGNSWLSARSDTANRWLEGEPTPLVADGVILSDRLRGRARTGTLTLSLRREHGLWKVQDLDPFRAAAVEQIVP